MKTPSLFTTLRELKGNPRGCVYTEPLWGLAFNLYAPYISIYMVSLGLADKQIGLIVTISWVAQILASLLSGVITDKMGRRLTTLVFDIAAWTIPALIWAVSQNFYYFLAAGVVNGMWRITLNSWTCLLVEEADPALLIDMYTWIYISGLFAAFFAPLTGFLIARFSLIPTMRGLYLFAAFMFTVKCITTYLMTHETQQGLKRMQETRHQSAITVLGEYRAVLRDLLHAPQTLYTGGIMLVMSICQMINGIFWGILVTEKLHIPAANLAVFPFLKTIIMVFFFFAVLPRIRQLNFKIPMMVGFCGFIASQLVLVTAPQASYVLLGVSIFLEAGSIATVSPLMDRMTALTVDPRERARIQSILYVAIIGLTSPFGWIAGMLSGLNKNLPFILNIALFSVGAVLVYLAGRRAQQQEALVEELASS